MSESETGSQRLFEQASASSPSRARSAVKDLETPEQPLPTGSATQHIHRDLNQIIARARADIRHLREELTRHETQIAAIVQERDDIQERYSHLYNNFVEAVHMAADEEVLQAAHSIRVTSGSLPALFAPIQESIISWAEQQLAEREAVLRQKVEAVEVQAAALRQELVQEREALQAERDKFAQERQNFTAHMKSREAALRNRWVLKAWGTAGVMFLVLPALQVYLLEEHASAWNLIIIPTTICLVLTALINLVRARRRPAPLKPQK
jgi:predicted  nucleic acid-binding Zn-ribbon protein